MVQAQVHISAPTLAPREVHFVLRYQRIECRVDPLDSHPMASGAGDRWRAGTFHLYRWLSAA
jgi:hypothetical protein